MLFGAWQSFRLVTVLACWGALIIGAVYMLRAVRTILHGPCPDKWTKVADAPHWWRKTPFVALLACLFVFGLFPRTLSDKLEPAVQSVLARTGTPAASAAQAAFTPAFSASLDHPPGN